MTGCPDLAGTGDSSGLKFQSALGEQLPDRFDQRGERDPLAGRVVKQRFIGRHAQSDTDLSSLIHGHEAYPQGFTRTGDTSNYLQIAQGDIEPADTDWRKNGHLGGEVRASNTQAIQQFCAYQRKRNLSGNTIRARRLRILAFASWLHPKHLYDATTKDIDQWLEQLNISPQTRYFYIGHLTAFYKWVTWERLTRKPDPTLGLVRPKLPKHQPRPWDEQEMSIAVDFADQRMRCWLLMAWLAGARVMEMAALRVEDIRPDVLVLRGKGDKERTVPLHPQLRAALLAHGLPAEGLVFRRRDGWPLLPSSISAAISRYCKSMGIQATAHQGRHAFATALYRNSLDLLMVADLMGHESMNTTRIYAQWENHRAANAVGSLSVPSTRPPPVGGTLDYPQQVHNPVQILTGSVSSTVIESTFGGTMQITTRLCDLEHTKPTDAAESVTVVRGKSAFELDLCQTHFDGLKDAGRHIIRDRAPQRQATNGKTPAIRQWGRENGFTVADRGKLAPDLVDAYNKAHQ